MNYTGYTVLKVPKTGAAFAYAKEAREFATGATGAGGYLNSAAITHGWTDVNFVTAIREGSSSLPVSIGATALNLYTGVATVIGGSTPIGDLRSEDSPYVGVGSATVYHTKKGQEYGSAFYATYIGNTNSSPTKIGIGTTAGDIATSGYYEGSFTTRNIYEFNSVYNADLDDPTKIITGSGVYRNGSDVSLQFNILNRNGELLTSASQIAADPFVERQIISILDSDSNVVFPSYRINGNSTFTFSRSQNIDVFGSYNRNFGIRNEIVNADGGTSTGEFYLYANTATFDKVIVQASGETSLNENLTNYSPPDTGSITSAADRADAIKYFNNQPISASGSTGFIELTLGFNESPNFTNLGDLTIWNGTSGDFATNIDNLVGNYPLSAIQEGQRIRLRTDDGITEKTPLFFKLIANSDVGFEPEILTIGPYTLEPILQGVDLNLYNQGDQSLVGDFTIEGGLEGDNTNGGNLHAVGEGRFDGNVGIGSLPQPNYKLYVEGIAGGSALGGRLQGPGDLPYLLSGDTPAGNDDLQDVTTRGDTTTTSIISTGPYISGSGSFLGTGDGNRITNNNVPYLLSGDTPAGNDDLQDVTTRGDTTTTSIISTGPYISGSGSFLGTGDGNRITNNNVPYLLSGDSPAETQNLQDVTANGNTTLGLDVNFQDGTLFVDHTNQRVGIGTNIPQKPLEVVGHSFFDGDVGIGTNTPSSKLEVVGHSFFDGHVGIGTYNPSSKLEVVGNNAQVEIATNDGYSIKSSQKAAIAVVGSGTISSKGSMMAGGSGHHISGDYDTIAGGTINNISGGDFNFIGGGSQIDITGSEYSSSIGGKNNDILNSNYSVIVGGQNNSIEGSFSNYIGGGENNLITGANSFIGGGNTNKVLRNYSFVGAGEKNIASGDFSIIIGGEENQTFGTHSVIAGGEGNTVSGLRSFIGGGSYSEVNSDYSYAFGRKAKITSSQSGAAVFADGNDIDTLSSGAHTATLNFENGVYVQTTSGLYVNGNPVMTGVNPYDEDTLQTVTDRGNETTTSIISTGPHISGVAGLFNSNVGIGTNNPSAKLDIHTATNSNGLFIREDTDDSITHNFYVDSSDNGVGVLYADGQSAKITLNTAGDSYFNGGNIGIGIATPAQKLEVFEGYIRVGDASNGGYGIEFERNSAIVGLINTANNRINIQAYNNRDVELRDTAGTGNLILKHGGDVGIGTVSPAGKLHVYNTSTTSDGDGTASMTASGQDSLLLYGHGGVNNATYGGITWMGGSRRRAMITAVAESADTDFIGLAFYTQGTDGAGDFSESMRIAKNGNVGIGTTSPGTYKLNVAGGGRFSLNVDFANNHGIRGIKTDNNPILIARINSSNELVINENASTTVPTRIVGDYITLEPTNFLGVAAEAVRIIDGGNVGIGTTSPSTKLQIGSSGSLGSTTNKVINTTFDSGYSTTNSLQYQVNAHVGTTTSTADIFTQTSGEVLKNFYVGLVAPNSYFNNSRYSITQGGAERIVVLQGGNVGIGTFGPSSRLEVVSNSSNTATFRNSVGEQVVTFGSTTNTAYSDILLRTNSGTGEIFKAGTGYTSWGGASALNIYNSNGAIAFHPNGASGTNAMFIATDGNVGIGTTGPSKKLEIASNTTYDGIQVSGTSIPRIAIIDTTNNATLSAYARDNDATIGTESNHPLTLNTNGTERLRISSAGAIKFNNYGAGTFTGTVTQKLGVDSSGNVIEMPIGAGPVDGSGTANYLARWIDSDTLGIGAAYDNGTNVGIGTTSPNSSSKLHVSGQVRAVMGNDFTQASTTAAVVAFKSFGYGSYSPQMNGSLVVANTNTEGTAGFISLAANYGNTNNTIYSAAGIGGGKETTRGDGNWGGYLNFFTTSDGSAGAASGAFEHMRITADGNVGIGTTSPGTYKLNVAGGGRFSLNVDFANNHGIRGTKTDNSVIKILGLNSSNELVINENASTTVPTRIVGDYITLEPTNFLGAATEAVRIIEGGNVGIGTTNPQNKLHVEGNFNGAVQIEVDNQNSGNASYAGLLLKGQGNNFSLRNWGDQVPSFTNVTEFISTASNSSFVFSPSNSERMRISSAGAIKFNNYGAGTFTGTVTQKLGVDSSGNVIEMPIGAGPVDGSGTANYLARWIDSDTLGIGAAYDNGTNVGIGTNTPNSLLNVQGDSDPTILINAVTGNSTNSGKLAFAETDGGALQAWIKYDGSANRLELGTSDVPQALVIKRTDGNVGIGTVSPATILDVSASIPILRISATRDSTATIGDKMAGFEFHSADLSGSAANSVRASINLIAENIYQSNTGLAFSTKADAAGDPTERLRIKGDGNVGIGTTAPSQKLTVNGEIGVADGAANAPSLTFSNDTDTGIYRFESSGADFLGITTGGVKRAQFSGAGIFSSANVYTADSSQFRNYGGTWKGTTGLTGNGFQFINSVDGTAMTLSSTGNMVLSGDLSLSDSKAVKIGSNSDLQLLHNGSSSSINNYLGNLFITQQANDASIIFRSDDGSGGVATYLTIDGLYEVVLFNKNASFGDNIKATFGNADLQIYHNGTYSYIDQPSGLLRISAPAFEIVNAAKSGYIARFFEAGNGNENVELYYAGSKQFETTSTGITVAGSIKIADDTDTASASKVGTMRYRTGTEYVDVDGVELVTNGDFDSATGWNLNSNWSISGGTCNADGTSNADINQNLVLGVVGQNYRITYVISAYTQGSIAARIGSGITDYNTGTGTFTQVVTATTTDRIRMNLTSNFIGSVDSLSIVKVTAEEASYADMCMQTAASTYEWVNIVKNSY